MDIPRKRIPVLRWLELLLSFVCFFLITLKGPADFEWTALCLFCAILCITMNSIILFLETGVSKEKCRHLSHFTEVGIFSLAVAFTTEAVVQIISVIEMGMLLQPGLYHFKPTPTWLSDFDYIVASTVCTCFASLLFWMDHHHNRHWIKQQGLVVITPKSIYGVKLTFSFILLLLLWDSEEKGIFSMMCFYLIAHIISVFKAATFIIHSVVSELKIRLGIICGNVALIFVYGQSLLLWPKRVSMQCSNEVYTKFCAGKETDKRCMISFYNSCAGGVTLTLLSSINLLLLIYDSISILYFHANNVDNRIQNEAV